MPGSRPLFDQVNLVVRDMQTTLEFYRALGLEIPSEPRPAGEHHVELEMPGGIRLELDSLELAHLYNAEARAPKRGNALLGFSLPTRAAVDERYASLTRTGYRGCQAPFDTFWGARYAIVEDPDGNQVGLMSPIDPARRSAPPDLS